MEEGRELETRCSDESAPAFIEEADAWNDRAEEYLRDNLEADYVARYRSSAGLPMGVTSFRSREHRNLSEGIDARLARLEQFLQELVTGPL